MSRIIPKDVIIFSDKKGKSPFLEWLESLDGSYRSRIEQRILRLSLGNYGDYKALQEGVMELRFTFGSGYRVYFGDDCEKIVVLLIGGDKSTQKKDIKKAIEYWQKYKEAKYD